MTEKLPDDATFEEFKAWEEATSADAARRRIQEWHSDGYATHTLQEFAELSAAGYFDPDSPADPEDLNKYDGLVRTR
jgi:hypothetical protein